MHALASALRRLALCAAITSIGCEPTSSPTSRPNTPPDDPATASESAVGAEAELPIMAPSAPASGSLLDAATTPTSSLTPRDSSASPPPSRDAENTLASGLGDAGVKQPQGMPLDTPGPGAPNETTQRAFELLRHAELSRVDDAIADLDQSITTPSDSGYSLFYSGAFRLWKTAEGLSTLEDGLSVFDLTDQITKRLASAHDALPNDFRITGFLGLAQVSTGLISADDALVEAGKRTLQHAVDQFPAYGSFLRATAAAGVDPSDPFFANAVNDMFALTKACGYAVDASGLTFSYPSDPDSSPHPGICLNAGIVPHVWEGIFITFGDLALKSGWDADKARALYRNAQASPTYKDWPYAALLEQRIEQAEQRHIAHTDDDPFNEPLVWANSGHICVGCHQASGAPLP